MAPACRPRIATNCSCRTTRPRGGAAGSVSRSCGASSPNTAARSKSATPIRRARLSPSRFRRPETCPRFSSSTTKPACGRRSPPCCGTKATPSKPRRAARRAWSGRRSETPDVILLDIWLPGLDGLATLERLRERRVDAEVIMISGHASVEAAVRATKLGAFDFIEKPLSIDKTVLAVRNALRQRRLEVENRQLRARVDRRLVIVGASLTMEQLREHVAMAAPSNGRVLISGENGTGKELVARQIHALSHRAQRAVRGSELRGDSRGADRIGAVRPRARRVHRRRGGSARQVRDCAAAARSSSTKSGT